MKSDHPQSNGKEEGTATKQGTRWTHYRPRPFRSCRWRCRGTLSPSTPRWLRGHIQGIAVRRREDPQGHNVLYICYVSVRCRSRFIPFYTKVLGRNIKLKLQKFYSVWGKGKYVLVYFYNFIYNESKYSYVSDLMNIYCEFQEYGERRNKIQTSTPVSTLC